MGPCFDTEDFAMHDLGPDMLRPLSVGSPYAEFRLAILLLRRYAVFFLGQRDGRLRTSSNLEESTHFCFAPKRSALGQCWEWFCLERQQGKQKQESGAQRIFPLLRQAAFQAFVYCPPNANSYHNCPIRTSTHCWKSLIDRSGGVGLGPWLQ